MSLWPVVTWAREQDVSSEGRQGPGPKLTLFVLVSRMDLMDNVASFTMDNLERWVGQDTRSIQRHLARLKELGLIESMPRRKRNEIRVRVNYRE